MRFQFIGDDLNLLSDKNFNDFEEVSKLAEELFGNMSGINRYISILNLDNMAAYKFDEEGLKRL